jgi:hypothetical protein
VRFPIDINKLNTRLYLPKQVIRQGFFGKTQLIVGPLTLIIVKPGATDQDVIKSLENTIEAIKLSQGTEPPLPEPEKQPT